MRIVGTLVALVAVVGCSDSQPPTTAAVEPAPAPASNEEAIRAVAERFLASIVQGDAAEATRWLTPAAAERTAREPDLMAPLGFQVSSLEIGTVRVLSDVEAAAQCWLAEPGAETPEEVCCLLKRVDAGWRVCGIACDASAGESPVVIGFEPPPKTAPGPSRNRDDRGNWVAGEPASPAARTAAAESSVAR